VLVRYISKEWNFKQTKTSHLREQWHHFTNTWIQNGGLVQEWLPFLGEQIYPVFILVVILYTGYAGMIFIYIDIVLYRKFCQFSFLVCIVNVFYVASETSGDWWSGGSGHRWGLGIPAQHTPNCLYVLLFQQQIVFPVTWRRNCKSRTVNAERSLLLIITYWACWKGFRWSYVTWWCPCRVSVRMEQLLSQWTDFQEIWYLSIFRKSVGKIQVSLKYDKNYVYFMWRPMYIFSVFLRMRNISGKECTENQNTRFMFNDFYPKIVPFVR